mgnify:CR=1 FL=1
MRTFVGRGRAGRGSLLLGRHGGTSSGGGPTAREPRSVDCARCHSAAPPMSAGRSVDVSRRPTAPTAAIAAPTIPASLRSCAAHDRAAGPFRRGMNRSGCLLTPPPSDQRFGENSLSIAWRCSSRSARPGLPRQAAPRPGGRRRASLRVPAADLHMAQLGVRDEDAVVEQARPDAGAERQHEDDAAFSPSPPRTASRRGPPHRRRSRTSVGRLTRRSIAARASKSIQPASMFAAVFVTPSMTTHGTPTPTGASAGISTDAAAAPRIARRTVRTIAGTTSAGVDGTGVATRSRGASSSPRATSTTPTLIPLPPTSTPIAMLAGRCRVVGLGHRLRSS